MLDDVGSWTYVLTGDEVRVAFLVAEIRNTHNGGQSNLPGGETATEEERLRQHRAGCVAEIGVSRLLNLAWTGCGKGSEGQADVGGVVEVRSIRERGLGLLVREKDHMERPYALVWCESSPVRVTLLGWEIGCEVRRRGMGRDLRTAKPYWTLSEQQLRPATELLGWIEGWWASLGALLECNAGGG